MEISGRRLFATLFIIGVVSMLVTAATHTWLSDTEEISWVIVVKSADLEVASTELDFGTLAPGDESEPVEITVKNTGDVTLEVSLSGESEWVEFEFNPDDFTLAPEDETTVTVKATLSEDYEESGATLEGTIIVYGEQKP